MRVLLHHPYQIRTSRREFEIDEPMSVADFCKKFNIPLVIKPRRGQVGSPSVLISLNREKADESSMITKDSVLNITEKWLFGSGPQENFEEWLGRLALTGKGIGGYPPFEELYDFEKDHLP